MGQNIGEKLFGSSYLNSVFTAAVKAVLSTDCTLRMVQSAIIWFYLPIVTQHILWHIRYLITLLPYYTPSEKNKNKVIGASLSEPHTSVTSLCTRVCMFACLLACLLACLD